MWYDPVMESTTLQQIITQYISLTLSNAKGWQRVQCRVCNDHTRKGLRGSFLFDDNTVVYKCFNCGIKAKYNPTEHESISKNMRRVLDAFGIPESDYQQVIFSSSAFINGSQKPSPAPIKLDNIEPTILDLPENFYFLKDAPPDDAMALEARTYLIEDRGIDPDGYSFMLAGNHKNKHLNKWIGRVIIPIYKNNKLIYYTGRAMYDTHQRYETPAEPKEKILYGFDSLFTHTSDPLLIVEGWFDAFAINGVATFGNIISKFQAEWLNRSQRPKIYIPDKQGDGQLPAQQALDFGWEISTPDIGSNCKDMDDAVKKYGRFFVIKSILDNRATGHSAKVKLAEYCN